MTENRFLTKLTRVKTSLFLVSIPLLFMFFSNGLTSAIANPAKQSTSIENSTDYHTGIARSEATKQSQTGIEQSVSVIDISERKYYPAVKKAIQEAKDSIYMVMYFSNFNPQNKKSPVNELVEELISAHKRGVKVKVILDQNISYAAWEERGRKWEREGKNDPLFVYLKKQGIEAYYDNLFVVTHSKVIVIDEEIVILGSANWTESALRKNWETSCLIRSKDIAGQLLEDFSRIPIDYEASILDEERNPPVRLSQVFLKDKSLAPRMLTAHDEIAFDLYLLLLRNFDGNAKSRVDIDYKYISQTLGIDERASYISARAVLRKALIRLDEKYQLISRKKRPSKSPYVILLDYPSKIPYTLPQERYFSIPDEYWGYGWNKSFSFSERYCYLINICKAGVARRRLWSSYIVGLTKEFNVSRRTITRGMKGLRKLNIIEIEYSAYPEEGGFEERGPTRFRLLGLYSPQVLKKEKTRLAKLYGKERFEKATEYAEIVFKGNDIQVIEDIIKKVEEYGIDQVDRAFRIVSEKATDNPKRSYKYVIGILQTEARQ